MKRVLVLPGTGIGVESGLQTFRGAEGLWEGHRVEDVATPEAWAANPALVLDFCSRRWRAVRAAQPNAALVRACLFALTLVTALAASAVAVERIPQELFGQAVAWKPPGPSSFQSVKTPACR